MVLSFSTLLCILTITVNCEKPKYILFTRTPGMVWNQNNPDSITPELLNQVITGLNISSATTNPDLYIGEEFIFSLFQSPQNTLIQTLHKLFNASLITNIPISIKLDGENWWSNSNLWNFYNKNETDSYNINNIYNVERYGWNISDAVEIGWRNWGSQIRILPHQNILSKQVLNKLIPILKAISNEINNWYNNILTPLNKEYLLSIIKIGWEAGVDYNAYYYENGNQLRLQNATNDPKYGLNFTKGLSGGLPLLGYAAANSSGLFQDKMLNDEVLDRYDVSNITKLYIDTLINILVDDIGINDKLIGNHVGGQYKPYNITVPFEAGFSEYGYPGWSFYDSIPQNIKQLKIEMMNSNRNEWIASEWFLNGGNSTSKWYNNFNNTLSFMNCHSLAVYNWDNSFDKNNYAIQSIQQLLRNF